MKTNCGSSPNSITSISLSGAINRDIGAIGTPERDEFEKEITRELAGNDCLSEYEQQLEKVVDKIKSTESTLENIVLLKNILQSTCWEHSIVPITFKDYNEYVDTLNDYGQEGWIFGAMIREYKNSPSKGITTHDYVCKRRKVI